MNDTLLQELWQAVAEGLARPAHFWSLVVVLTAIAGAWLSARFVRSRTAARLAAGEGSGVGGDALRFSIEGMRRLAFPLVAQALLWLGEAVLRLAGVLAKAPDAQLLRLAMTLFAAMALIRLVVYVLRRTFHSVALIAAFERAIAIVVWLVVALYATGVLSDVVGWLEGSTLALGRTSVSLWAMLMGAVSIVVALLSALWLGSALEARLMRTESIDRNVRAVLARVLRSVLVLLAVLLGLAAVGIDLTVLSVFGGALGVGLGLGLQRVASNYVSGFIILLDRSLRIGDMITVDKYHGLVTEINTRYTVIRALDGTEAIVPNEMLVATPVTNHAYSDKRVRLAVKVAVRCETDLDVAMTQMVEAAQATSLVLAEPAPQALLLGFGADGLELEVGFWVHHLEPKRVSVQSDVARAMLARFREHAVGMARAQREVRVSGWGGANGKAAGPAAP